jgi:hypothetical protein
MLDKLCDGSAEVSLSDRNDPVEAFVFNRSDKAFSVCIRIRRALRRPHHAKTGVAESPSHGAAPFSDRDRRSARDARPTSRDLPPSQTGPLDP